MSQKKAGHAGSARPPPGLLPKATVIQPNTGLPTGNKLSARGGAPVASALPPTNDHEQELSNLSNENQVLRDKLSSLEEQVRVLTDRLAALEQSQPPTAALLERLSQIADVCDRFNPLDPKPLLS
jgi:hypothetical protein